MTKEQEYVVREAIDYIHNVTIKQERLLPKNEF